MSGTLGNNKALYNNNVVIKPFSTFIGTGLVQVYLFIYLFVWNATSSFKSRRFQQKYIFKNSRIEFHDAVGLFINIHELSVSIISSHNLGHLGVDSSC